MKTEMTIHNSGELTWLSLPGLEMEGIRHGFSTRKGGVSKGYLSTMNLSFNVGDQKENVLENFARIGSAIGFSPEELVLTDQVHEDRIRLVTAKDRGDGILRETARGIDGLITNEPGVTLSVFFADCVPLLFYDPAKKVIATAHSGWRGTVRKIGARVVEMMRDHYGCNAADLHVGIGPSICSDCYEVSREVYHAFSEEFTRGQLEIIFRDGRPGHFQLDLWEANRVILKEAGIPGQQIHVAGLCRCCHSDQLFSHRASGGKRGTMGGFIRLENYGTTDS